MGAEGDRESGLVRAEALLDALSYAEAIETAEAVLRRGGNQPEALVALYRLLGRALAAVDRVDEAKSYWRRLLALRPDHSVDAQLSPKIRRPLVEALADWAGRPGLTFVHRPPATATVTAPLALRVKIVEDPVRMAQRVRVEYRLPGDAAPRYLTSARRLSESVVIEVPLAALGARRGTMRYRVELLDESDNIVARRGTATRPLSVSLVESARAKQGDVAASASSPPWYRRWWVWTLAGAVLAGAAATTAVMVATSGSPDESRLRVGYSVAPP